MSVTFNFILVFQIGHNILMLSVYISVIAVPFRKSLFSVTYPIYYLVYNTNQVFRIRFNIVFILQIKKLGSPFAFAKLNLSSPKSELFFTSLIKKNCSILSIARITFTKSVNVTIKLTLNLNEIISLRLFGIFVLVTLVVKL